MTARLGAQAAQRAREVGGSPWPGRVTQLKRKLPGGHVFSAVVTESDADAVWTRELRAAARRPALTHAVSPKDAASLCGSVVGGTYVGACPGPARAGGSGTPGAAAAVLGVGDAEDPRRPSGPGADATLREVGRVSVGRASVQSHGIVPMADEAQQETF